MKKYRSCRGEMGKAVPNLLARDFHEERPIQLWVTSVTAFSLHGSKPSPSPGLDLYNGEGIRYAIGERTNYRQVEEVLYPAMEDYCIDIVVGKDSATVRSIRLDLPPFTLVGATTRAGDLSAPLRDRFGIISQLEYYALDELEAIIRRTARVMDTQIHEDAVHEIALRSRGTPRIANRLFRRVRDFAQVLNDGVISKAVAADALDRLRVDSLGLDSVDHKYIRGIIERFRGGPVGLDAIASSIGEESMTLEDVYEPYLLQIGFINRTARGRIVTEKAYRHFGYRSKEEDLFTLSDQDE